MSSDNSNKADDQERFDASKNARVTVSNTANVEKRAGGALRQRFVHDNVLRSQGCAINNKTGKKMVAGMYAGTL